MGSLWNYPMGLTRTDAMGSAAFFQKQSRRPTGKGHILPWVYVGH